MSESKREREKRNINCSGSKIHILRASEKTSELYNFPPKSARRRGKPSEGRRSLKWEEQWKSTSVMWHRRRLSSFWVGLPSPPHPPRGGRAFPGWTTAEKPAGSPTAAQADALQACRSRAGGPAGRQTRGRWVRTVGHGTRELPAPPLFVRGN